MEMASDWPLDIDAVVLMEELLDFFEMDRKRKNFEDPDLPDQMLEVSLSPVGDGPTVEDRLPVALRNRSATPLLKMVEFLDVE